LLVASFFVSGQSRASDTKPLNVIWLSVEDMSPWIGPYGDKTVPTPNLDKLAAQGVTYDNAFATTPVCAPARSSLITGEFCTRIGTMHMRNNRSREAGEEGGAEAQIQIPGYEGLPPEFVRCFPEHLRAAGYYCTNNNKKDYQFKDPVTVWDESSNTATWKIRAEGQPFFAVFNFNGTHESRGFPAAKPTPVAVKTEDVTVPPIYPDTPAVRNALSLTYNNIAAMDSWIGQHIEELEKAGLMDNTVVIFFSDHGVGLPRGKRSCFDTGTRVPLIVRYPDGKLAGTREKRVVSFIDFGPSVLSLAGIKPDERLDGTPFLGQYATQRDDYRNGYAYANGDRFDTVYDRARTVSDGRFRYTRNYDTNIPYILHNKYRESIPMTFDLYKLQENGPQRPEQWQIASMIRQAEEFYDSQSDPWEVKNLIDDPQYKDKIAELRTKLDAWIRDTGDLGFVLPETKLVEEKIWPPDGKQPTTPAGELVVAKREGMYNIQCSDGGASIGYRLSEDGNFSGAWQVCTGPAIMIAPKYTHIQIQTHRIGHKPTTVVKDLKAE